MLKSSFLAKEIKLTLKCNLIFFVKIKNVPLNQCLHTFSGTFISVLFVFSFKRVRYSLI